MDKKCHTHTHIHVIKLDLEHTESQACKISHLIIRGSPSSCCTKTWQIEDSPGAVSLSV